MKKSFPVHLGQRIYYFDDDAYERLNNYYNNLRLTFDGDDGAEIVSDIETRISEIISDRHQGDDPAFVTIDEVNGLITRMGRPEELCEEIPHEETAHPSSTSDMNAQQGPPPFRATAEQRHLYRDMNNKVIGGVLSGLANYWGTSVTALRVLAVILSLITWFWPLVIIYIFAWILIPPAVTPRQILQMNGREVTVDTVGQTTIFGTYDRGAVSPREGFWKTAANVIGIIFMSFLGLVCSAITIAMVVLLVLAVAGIITFSTVGSLQFVPDPNMPVLSLITVVIIAMVWLIPAIAGIWATCCTLFKAKGVSRRTAIIIAAFETLLIIAAVLLSHFVMGVKIYHITFPAL